MAVLLINCYSLLQVKFSKNTLGMHSLTYMYNSFTEPGRNNKKTDQCRFTVQPVQGH